MKQRKPKAPIKRGVKKEDVRSYVQKIENEVAILRESCHLFTEADRALLAQIRQERLDQRL